jgi:hypothetical protein
MIASALFLLLAHFNGHDPVGGTIHLHPQDGPDADVRTLIEQNRVRMYVKLNLAYVDEVIDLAREDETRLHPAEFSWYREGLLEYLHDTNRVVIDGVEVAPVDVGFESMDADLSMLPQFPQMGERALAKVQLALDFPVKTTPKSVRIYWGSYPPDRAIGDETFMPSVLIRSTLVANGIESEVVFSEEEPEFTWHNTGESAADLFLQVPEPVDVPTRSIPMVSLCLFLVGATFSLVFGRKKKIAFTAVAASIFFVSAWFVRDVAIFEIEVGGQTVLPSAEQAEQIFEPLHANIYRAFDYTSESDIYDALAQSVDGPLLDSLYNQIYRGLIMQDQGGAVSRVQAVRPLEIVVDSIGLIPDDGRYGFDVTARWQVDGRVTHWGHGHERTNEYLARYTVLQTEQGWRIGGSQVQEQSRVSATPEDG